MSMLRMSRFALVGLANTGIDLAVFTLLAGALQWSVLPANVLSYSTGILNSFFLNKYWTFRDRTPLSRSLPSGVRFVLVNLVGLVISTVTVMLLARLFPVLLAKALSVTVVFAWNYVLSRRLVFTSSSK